MSLDHLQSLRADPRRRRLAELSAIAHAVRPLAADFASTILFYALLAGGGGVRAATIAGVVLGFGQLAYMLLRGQRPSAMQVASIALVGLVGGITLLTNDARFMFWKVSAIYVVVGAAMLRPGWMRRHVPPIAAEHLPQAVLAPWERAWAGLLILTAAVNLTLSLTQSARTTALVFGVFAPASKVALFVVQYVTLRHRTRRRIREALEATG